MLRPLKNYLARSRKRRLRRHQVLRSK